MRKILCLLLCLCVWTLPSRAGAEGDAEDATLKDLKGNSYPLEDAMLVQENEVEGVGKSEDEWGQPPPLTGQGCQNTRPGKGCGLDSTPVQWFLDPNNPTALKFWDTNEQEFIEDPEDEENVTTPVTSPPLGDSLDAIQRRVIPNPSNTASPDFQATSTSPQLASSTQPPLASQSQQNPCSLRSLPPSPSVRSTPVANKPNTPRSAFVPVSQPATANPWQISASQSEQHMLQAAAVKTIQISQPVPVRRKTKKFRRVQTKQKCKPKCQPCKCPKPKKRFICKKSKPKKRSMKMRTCKRDECVMKRKPMTRSITQQPRGCKRSIVSCNQRTVSKPTLVRRTPVCVT